VSKWKQLQRCITTHLKADVALPQTVKALQSDLQKLQNCSIKLTLQLQQQAQQ
jgi:hypothetical protein